MIRFLTSKPHLLFYLTGLTSGYDIGFITYAKYMRNKEFSSEKTAKSWLTVHQPKEFLLTFHNFPVAFFLLLFTAKTWKFSRICLQVLHIFKGELYGMSIIVSKKKVEWHKDFLGFFLGVQTVNLQNYYAPQEDSMQIFLRWPVMHFFHRA